MGRNGGVAGKEDNGNPVLGWREACREDGNTETSGQWKTPAVCFIPQSVNTEIITLAFCQWERELIN